MIKFNYDNIYSLTIFILPLIGILASNIYTSLKSKTWYSNLKIMMPDIFSGNYGLYITSFIFIFTGMSLFLLLQVVEGKDYILEDTDKRTTWKNTTELDMIMLWLIPIIFFLIYIINPIMYQVQNTLPGAIMYIFVLLTLIIFTVYTVKFSVYISIFLVPLILWALYMTLFLFTITDPSKAKPQISYNIPDNPMNPMNPMNPVKPMNPVNPVNPVNPMNISTPNNKPINQSPQYQIKTGKHLNIVDNTVRK